MSIIYVNFFKYSSSTLIGIRPITATELIEKIHIFHPFLCTFLLKDSILMQLFFDDFLANIMLIFFIIETTELLLITVLRITCLTMDSVVDRFDNYIVF
jgi:hypothetical protein